MWSSMRQKITSGAVALVFRQAATVPFNAAGALVVARLLNPADFAVQAVLIPGSAFALMLVDLGTSQAIVQCDGTLSRGLLRSINVLKIAMGAATLATLSLMSPFLAQHIGLPADFSGLFPVCGIIGCLQSARAYRAAFFQRRLDWTILARIEVAESIAYNIILVAAAWLSRSAWCFCLALAFRSVVGLAILGVVDRSPAATSAGGRSSLWSLLRFGLPLQTTTVLGIIMNSVNPLVVGRSLGSASVGLVNWSTYLATLPQVPLQPLPNFLFSVLAERRRRRFDDAALIGRLLRASTLLMAFVSGAMAVLLEPVILRIFGAKWAPATPLASVLLLGNIIFLPSILLGAVFNASGHSKLWLLLSALGCALQVISCVAGTLAFGAMGYVVGVTFASAILLGIQCRAIRRVEGLHVSWSMVTGGVAAAALGIAVQRVTLSVAQGLLVQSAACCAGIAAISLYLLFLDRGDLRGTFKLISSWFGFERTR